MAAKQPAAQRWDLSGLSVIAFAHGTNDFYAGIVPIVIFYDVTRAGLPPWYQGALAFLWYVTSSVVQPVFGTYSDRHGRWWFLPAAVGLTVAAISLSGTTASIPLLALCIVVGGLGSAILHPEAGKYSAMLSGGRRTSGISIFQIGGQIGYGLGPAVIGLLLGRFGGGGSLVLLGPGAIAAVVLFALMRRVDAHAGTMHRAHIEKLPDARGPVDRLGVTLLVVSTSLRHLVGAAFAYYLPNLLTARGFSLAEAGTIVTGFLVFAVVGMYAGGTLGDRFGPVSVSVVSLCAAVPALALALTQSGAVAVTFLLAGSVLLAVQNAPGVAMVQAMLPRNLGMAMGLLNGVAFGIGSAAVAGIGVMVARYGADAALLHVSAVPLASAAAYLVVARRLAARRYQPV